MVPALLLAALIGLGLYPSRAFALQDPPPVQNTSGEKSGAAAPLVPPLPAPEEEFIKRLAEPPRPPIQPSTGEPSVPPALPVVGVTWVAQGPGPINNGQTEGIANGHVIGAIQAIVAHPANPDIVWIGAVNGGVWKTTNATNANPTWTPTGDTFSSLSIGALGLDPTDGTRNTLVAGIGRFSSFSSVGGPRAGLLRTTDGGTNWTALTPALLTGKNISGLAARGATIVVSVNIADSFTCNNIGIFRSIDTGATFSRISGAGGTGLPRGVAFDLASDPTNNAVLYTALRDTTSCGGTGNGIYRSTDTGATWTRVSDAVMEALMLDTAGTNRVNNTRIAVGMLGEVYAGIIDNGQLAGLFRSGNGGTSWTQLDAPSTNEGGTSIGLQPTEKPGSQGSIHFSIDADPTNANIVYVGGDRQPLTGDGNAGNPNSLGATNYTGRLFRVDASQPAGSQATSLTHCQTATAACNNTTSTFSNSSPHADSRRMVFDAAGNILEGDDGGIYRRTNPRTTGDWFSVMGNLRVTEMHDAAYDTVSNMIISGNQDTGTSEQTTVGGTTWNEVNQGDGGDVAVDDISSGTQSTRYTSSQNLGGFRRRIVNTSGVTTSTVFPARTVTGGGPAFVGQFATPVELNVIDPTRILFAGFNDLYESLDRGDTITALGFNEAATAIVPSATAMVYGGKSGGVDNVDLIYAISITDGANILGSNVFVRTGGSGAPVPTATSPGTTVLQDIAVDPADWNRAYVVNSIGEVFSTSNTGATWTDTTGNLGSGTNDLRTIVFLPGTPSAIVVGGVNGVFRMATDNVGVWTQLGTGLSNAPVWDLDYDVSDDTLVAGTMGRGAWKLNPALNTGPLPALSINDVTVTEGNSGSTNAVFTVSLSASSASTITVNYATADDTATAPDEISTFSNSGSINIPDGNATPYPSDISVSGVTGTITEVTATLTGFTHTFTADVDVLLVGPGGQSVVLMSDVGEGVASNSLNLTFDDAAAAALSDPPLASGTYRPTNIDNADTFGSPAPASDYGSALSVFNATSPNGTWSLYIVDDTGFDSGSISGGWTLNISTPSPSGDYTATSGTLLFNPSTTSQTISVPVLGDVVDEPNETFFVNLSGAGNATILDAQGQATILDDDGATPTISTINPASGPAAGGQSVTITGTNLSGATSVTFGGTAGAITANSATSITVTTAAHAAGAVNVVVTTAGGSATSTGGYTYVAAPTISNINPASGAAAGGQSVTITGTNLSGATSVTFGGTAGAITANSATSITVTTAAHAAGAVNVVVTTAGGSATSTGGYTYVAAPTISSFSPTSGVVGASVTITGTNLTGATAVRFNGVAVASFIINSATQIATTVPSGATSGPISVTTSGGTATSASSFTVTVASPPTISSISPARGSIDGGTAVTIAGNGFVAGASVTFGGLSATNIVVSATQITANTPAHTAGDVNVVVTNPSSQSATLTNGFTYLRHGDADGDGAVAVADIFFLINNLFAGGPAPVGSADVDGNNQVNVADLFYLINFLFAGGPPPV